jgi:hypothetical protein
MAVRWYLRHPLSDASVMELLGERGIHVSKRTVLRWVQTFGPLLAAEAWKHSPISSQLIPHCRYGCTKSRNTQQTGMTDIGGSAGTTCGWVLTVTRLLSCSRSTPAWRLPTRRQPTRTPWVTSVCSARATLRLVAHWRRNHRPDLLAAPVRSFPRSKNRRSTGSQPPTPCGSSCQDRVTEEPNAVDSYVLPSG